VEGESLSPDDCSQLGKCSVRRLPPDLPMQTPIEVRFRYEENGRLTVTVQVEGTSKQLQHEIARENSLTQEQLDSWRMFVSRQPPLVSSESNAGSPAKTVPDAMLPPSKSTAPSVNRDLASIAAEVLEADEE
jgi:hypothetical protein